jgi:hypothetical protein
MGETEDFTKYTPELKELTLAAFDFEDLFESLSKNDKFPELNSTGASTRRPWRCPVFLGRPGRVCSEQQVMFGAYRHAL